MDIATFLIISEAVFFALASVVLALATVLLILLIYNTLRFTSFLKNLPEKIKKAFDHKKQEFYKNLSLADFVYWIFKRKRK